MGMKILTLLFISVAMTRYVWCYDVVYDPINHTVNIANLIRDAETAVKSTETALNTLGTYENTILQVARLGDPAALRSIPGVSTIAELYGTGQRLMSDYQRWQGYLNPKRYQQDANYILGSYSQPQWNGYSTYSGYNVGPAQGLYQFDTARYNVATAADDELKRIEEQRQRLETQRDTALQGLQSATTDAQVKKYHGVLDGLNGAIAELGARANEVAHRVTIKGHQIQAGQQIYQTSQAEQRAAAAYQGVDQDLRLLPADNFRQTRVWGSN